MVYIFWNYIIAYFKDHFLYKDCFQLICAYKMIKYSQKYTSIFLSTKKSS